MARKAQPAGKIGRNANLVENRRARRDYDLIEFFEAGIALSGTEVKSIRAGQVSINESYARIDEGQAWLCDLHVEPYEFGNIHNHEPRRQRRLLMHRAEIYNLSGRMARKGLTLVPMRLYLKRGKVKVELGLGRGKQARDKRETIKRREADIEARREMRRTH